MPKNTLISLELIVEIFYEYIVLSTFQTFCPEGTSLHPLSSSGQEKGVFLVGVGGVLCTHMSKKGMCDC